MNKNSINICKVFVTSLNSKLQQCFPPLWLNIPHSLQELERAEPGYRDLPLKLTL